MIVILEHEFHPIYGVLRGVSRFLFGEHFFEYGNYLDEINRLLSFDATNTVYQDIVCVDTFETDFLLLMGHQ